MTAVRSILYVGTRSGTCLQRARALGELGLRVEFVAAGEPPRRGARFPLYAAGNRFGHPPDVFLSNSRIRRALARARFDVLWVDKGRSLRAATLAWARRHSPGTRLVAYSPDDMFHPGNHSARYARCIPLYDLHVTTKSFNVAELEAAGARRVLFVDKAYDPETHRPLELTAGERRRYAADVSFVGHYEREMGDLVQGLAEAGVPVTVWGVNWTLHRRSHPGLRIRAEFLPGLDYAKAINATRINLGLLRRASRDRQTARSVEIPACRAFMLAERSDEHLRLFEEGVEAEFFSSFQECLEKCRHYLAQEGERLRIADAGYQRCLDGRYDLHSRLRGILDVVEAL